MDRKVLWQALNSVCGLALSVFLAMHIIGISTILISPEMFNSYAETLEKSLFAKIVVWLVLGALVFHTAYGIKVASEVYAKPHTAERYILDTKSRLNGFWVAQVVSGSLLAFFTGIHIWTNFFAGNAAITNNSVFQKLQNSVYYPFYFFFVALLAFHVVVGARLILVKYGIGSCRQRKFAIGFLLLFVGVFMFLAFWNVWIFVFLKGGG